MGSCIQDTIKIKLKNLIHKIINIFKPWFAVDSRALGLYRIVFGLICLADILRRWEFIDIFYTQGSIIQASVTSSVYKNFTLLNTFTSSWEVHFFFILGILFSILLIIGYKTKLSQIMCAIIILSIHNRAIMLENAGDFFMNCMLVWSAFLPLGLTFSIDSLRKTLSEFKENSISDLNDRYNGMNKSATIYSLAFFCVLFQLSTIYFFAARNKTGYDWSNGTSVYKMFQLDTFLTPIGYFLRDYVTLPISQFFTYTTVGIQDLAPFLLFIPFYSRILRYIFIFCYIIFHTTIRLAVKVGLFSYIMMSTYILLIDKRTLDKIKLWFLNRYKKNQYILFYDSDCGFCHYSVRIIKRIDLFNRITFADASYKGKKPNNFEDLFNSTAILLDTNSSKMWIKHEVFGKILFLIPFGFIIGWIFFIPGLSKIFEFKYDFIAKRRVNISTFFGQPACGIKPKNIVNNNIVLPAKFSLSFFYLKKVLICIVLFVLIRANFNYALAANDGINDFMEDYGFGKNYFKHDKTSKIIVYYPRMIQKWNMFAPTVLASTQTIIVEATLSNGDVINPYTGDAPILNSLEYPILWHDHNQFWRKFFSRITKKSKKNELDRYLSWLKKYNNDYFKDRTDGHIIKSVKVWALSQRNTNINSEKVNKVTKRLLNPNSSNSPPKRKIKPIK